MRQIIAVDAPTKDKINVALSGNLANVTRWSTQVLAYNGTVGSAVVVQHDLGAVPAMIHVVPMVDARWWVDQDDANAWTATAIQFHASHKGQYRVRAGAW